MQAENTRQMMKAHSFRPLILTVAGHIVMNKRRDCCNCVRSQDRTDLQSNI